MNDPAYKTYLSFFFRPERTEYLERVEKSFPQSASPLCGIFYPHSVAVARYAALIQIKSPTNWDSQLTK
ncbi:MAG: DUF6783 domain-containing protein, partial [Lachnospiraceae bacterium]|nr:DUF6783 domain-containing protein [Lachnospiraceae bacterium]